MGRRAGCVAEVPASRVLRTLTAVLAVRQTIKQQYMFQYFLKVVSTQFQTLDGKAVRSPLPRSPLRSVG